MTEIRAVIFDLDGVLTDTAEAHFQAWKRLADEQGLPFTREDNEALRGVPRRRSLELILGDRSISEVEMQALMDRKNRYYREMIQQLTPANLLPGAAELLAELRQAGIRVAIASASKNARDVIARLGIEEMVDAVADGSSVERQKPAPDLFLHAARQLGVPPAACVVVEDAASGVEAAHAAGMCGVGIGPAARVGDADAVFPSLECVGFHGILQALELIRT